MRRLFALLGLLALVGLVAACASSAAGSSAPKVQPAPKVDAYTGGPRLAFDNQSVDFGPVPYNKEVKATYQVKNVGDQKLTIKNVDVKTVQGC
jgi:HYDIN/CFA65/VesB family protein